VADLIATIDAYLAAHKDHPKPFVWTKSAGDILAKVQRARTALARSTVSRAQLRRTTLALALRTLCGFPVPARALRLDEAAGEKRLISARQVLREERAELRPCRATPMVAAPTFFWLARRQSL
jgi:hypothetical protein